MAGREKEYERLPGRGMRRGAILQVVATFSRLWLAKDHLLLVDSNGFVETYKRFSFRDVQAVILTRTTRTNACRNAIYALEPRRVNPDYDEVCSFIRLRLRRRALIVFLTALDDPALAESFVRGIELVSRQHLILVNVVQPPGAAPLFSDPNVSGVDDLYEHLGGHLRWHNLKELGKVLKRKGVDFSVMDNERLSAQLMAQYLNVKRRQLL